MNLRKYFMKLLIIFYGYFSQNKKGLAVKLTPTVCIHPQVSKLMLKF